MLRLLASVAVVFLLSGVFVGGAQPVAVGLIPAPWDKLAHTALFAQITLALLLAGGARPVWTGGRALVALRCGRGLLWGAAALALTVGAGDEVHQASLPGRNAGWDDLAADLLGVLLVVGWVLWAARHLAAASTHAPGLVRVRERVRVRRVSRRQQCRRWFMRYGRPALASMAVMGAVGVYAWLAHTDTSGRHVAVAAPPGSVRAAGVALDEAGVAAAGQAVERTTALKPVALPADDAPHATGMEWWYYNGHLRGAKGEHYAFHVAIFLHDGMVRHTVFHGSLTDLRTGKRHERQLRTAGLPTTVTEGGFDFQFGGWRVAGAGAGHSLEIGDQDFSVTLQMRDAFAPMLHRAAGSATPGLLDFGVGGISYYYSRPRIAATGTVVQGGVKTAVRGDVWFDHQWGDFDGGGLAWNWFALQLDGGHNVMLYELFDAKGRRVMKMGSIAGPDGVARPIADADITLQPQGAWTSPATGVRYPAAWQVRLPEGVLNLTPLKLASEFDARTSTFNIYWEGAVRVSGARTGQGFVELSGYERVKSLWPASAGAAQGG